MERMERENRREQARKNQIARRFGRKWEGKTTFTSPREVPDRVREGEAVRNQVSVLPTEALGIVHTRIHRPTGNAQPVGGRPGDIMQHMAAGDTYDRLRVEQGAGNGGVKVTPPSKYDPNTNGQTAPIQSPEKLAEDLTANTAVINGGFFQHIPEFSNYGKPVGSTKGREKTEDREESFLSIPKPYRNDYRTLNVDNEVGISSGPKLESSRGKKKKFKDDRFQRHNQNQDEYGEVGNLNHASDKNPRAAISIFPPKNKVPSDVIMHTLTTGNAPRGGTDHRPRGATMKEWQDITTQGSYQYKPDEKKAGNITQRKQRPSTLNLDGGGSVYMGITRGNEPINQIASEKPNPTAVSNIIFAGGGQENEGKEISIEGIKD